MSLTNFTGVFLIFIGLLVASRKGAHVVASHLLLAAYFLVTLYASYVWGVDMPIVVFASITLIFFAGILVDSRYSVLVTTLLCISLFTIGYLQLKEIIPVENYWRLYKPSINDLVEQPIILWLVTIVAWLSNRELEKSLHRARRSEQSLKEERDLLEIKVEERTKELKRVQGEKISQLYRFAEFGRLSSGMFHDLINPLTAVSLQLNEAAENTDKIPQAQTYLNKAITASKRMEHFIHALRKQISFQQIERSFCVNEEIEDALDLVNYNARSRAIEIIFKADGRIELYGNPIAFHQSIVNLVSNAIDSYENYTGNNKTIEISLHQTDTSVVIRVTDHGCGISSEIIERIFDPFFTTKVFHKGTGIGLSQTKLFIEKQLNGAIRVKSTPGKGSTFILTLPKSHEHSSETKQEFSPKDPYLS